MILTKIRKDKTSPARERNMISTIQIKEIIPHRNNIRNKLFLFRRRICGVGKR